MDINGGTNNSNTPIRAIGAGDSPSIDAFSRWRVSNPVLLLAATFEDDAQTLVFESAVTATGTATHLPNESLMRLRAPANGDDALVQSRQYFAYRTGQSQLALLTFVAPTATAGVNYEVGYGDTSNGIFLRVEGTTVNFTKRSSTSGSPVDTDVPQASWNLDALDGTGPSGLTLDLDGVAQILVIDLQWLGVGRVRIGFDIGGLVIYAHEFLWANIAGSTTAYMATARLPVRWYIQNVSGGAVNYDMKAICGTVQREGTEPEPSHTFGVDIGDAAYGAPVTGLMSILAVRVDPNNPRVALIPNEVHFLVTGTDPVRWRLVLNPTLGASLSYADADSGSLVEFSTDNQTVTGGTVIATGFAAAGAAGNRGTFQGHSVAQSLPASSDIAGTTQDQYVLAVESLGGSGTTDMFAAIEWLEVR